jgi:ligand-binding SRPBCC domain-containing protein
LIGFLDKKLPRIELTIRAISGSVVCDNLKFIAVSLPCLRFSTGSEIWPTEYLPRRISGLPTIFRLSRQQTIPASLDQVWTYFATPSNLNEMIPPEMDFEILHGGDEMMYPGRLIEYRVTFIPGVSSRWLTEITYVREMVFFVDEQRLGPYRFWIHEHRFAEVGGKVHMKDLVTYAMPFGRLGDILHAVWVRNRLMEIFDFRQKKLRGIFG